jgi:hypothetical protein
MVLMASSNDPFVTTLSSFFEGLVVVLGLATALGRAAAFFGRTGVLRALGGAAALVGEFFALFLLIAIVVTFFHG